jgi:type IV fimbrial biogenesis protein FimT
MMFTLVVLAILIAIGIPAMGIFIEKNRLKGAAQAAFNDLAYARSEAIKRNHEINVNFITDGALAWCYGIDENANCDCTIADPNNANACALNAAADGSSATNTLKVTSASSYPTIKMTSVTASNVAFNPTRGIADGTTAIFQSESDKQIKVIVSTLGRVRVCSPSGSTKISGYPDC